MHMEKEFHIQPGKSSILDENAYQAVLRHWDSLAKPLDGLGDFEKLIAQIGGIRHTDRPSIRKRTLLVFLADNGIVEEGVSQSDASVTHKVAEAMAQDRSTVCVMAKEAGVTVRPIDVGMAGEPVPGVENCRIRSGSRNFLKEPAMTTEETRAAMEAGYQAVLREKERGTELILLGEMGIGNTTTATAAGCALLELDPDKVTGHGAGLSQRQRNQKCTVIKQALQNWDYDRENAREVLSLFGGYDIAAMTGAILAGAECGIPIVLDGLITLSAALVAERLAPGVRQVCIPSHNPREPMGKLLLSKLHLDAVIDAKMALGEGTGAVLLIPQLDVCMALYDRGARFEGIGMDAYQRYEHP